MLGWELPPYNSGGLGVACFNLARALSAEGAEIDFVLPAHAQYEDVDFMNIHQLSPDPLSTTVYPGIVSKVFDPYTNDYSQQLLRTQREYIDHVRQLVVASSPAVIHSNDWLTLRAGVVAKQIANVPLIAHVHSTEFDRAGNQPGNPLVHEIESHGLHAADHIVAVSEVTKQQIIDSYHIPADKIEVIHNSVDHLPDHTTEDSAYRYITTMKSEGYLIVATVGRLTVQKGLDYFLEAAAKAISRHHRMIFVIAGDGELRDELVAKSADLGIAGSVIFTGFVRGAAWRDVYTLADVFVMSSRSEPFGLTALEAAQHGTAITLTYQSGVSEVLKSALRYDYWDSDRLADQLLSLATTHSLTNQLAQDAQNEVAAMSWRTIAARFMSRYDSLTRLEA